MRKRGRGCRIDAEVRLVDEYLWGVAVAGYACAYLGMKPTPPREAGARAGQNPFGVLPGDRLAA